MDAESVADLIDRYQQTAEATLVRAGYDYIAAGAEAEISLREAVSAWQAFRLRPRVLRDVSNVDTSTTVLGVTLQAPIMVAPTAYHALAHAEGEVETARGVDEAASLFVVPTRSSMAHEQVAATLQGPWWFQVYITRDRELTRKVVNNAVELGASALMLTGDTPLLSRRRRGAYPPVTGEQYLMAFRNYLAGDAEYASATAQDPSIDLSTIAWLGEMSGLPVIVKGVLRGDDAVACVDAGAAAVVVSNHGGRQLDRAVPSAAALGEVVEALGGRGVVLVDGGIRSGIDILIALALGAQAVMVGRPVQWALAAEGASGVERVLSGLRAELEQSMALAGASSVRDVDRSLIAPGASA